MIDLEKMAREHEQLFPICSLESQILKMEEELNELKQAATIEQVINETADCIIVCAGIYRFSPLTAQRLLGSLVIMGGMEEAVERKWNINMNRKWKFVNGVYKHVGKDGHE